MKIPKVVASVTLVKESRVGNHSFAVCVLQDDGANGGPMHCWSDIIEARFAREAVAILCHMHNLKGDLIHTIYHDLTDPDLWGQGAKP